MLEFSIGFWLNITRAHQKLKKKEKKKEKKKKRKSFKLLVLVD
jgi:hypothetical protein